LFCFAALQITAAAGNRLAHPLFSELSRLGKRFHKSEITQIPPITLSGIVKVSHLLRPIRPGFMFSVLEMDFKIILFYHGLRDKIFLQIPFLESQNPSGGYCSHNPYGL
jgi:hypothetical protein